MASTLASRDPRQFTRDEFLWDLRSDAEGDHRYATYRYAVQLTYMPSVLHIDHLPEMSATDFVDTCNKSVPIYLTPSRNARLLRMVLHNYIYRRWFRPYRSEIERLRYLCKTISPIDLDVEVVPSQQTISTLLALNQAICSEVEARHHTYDKQLESSSDEVPLSAGNAFMDRVEDHKLHILQPLFRALVIITCSESYHNEDSKNIGKLPVLLVRTGIEDGLSAPITFESIQDQSGDYAGNKTKDIVNTTLEVAIDFVMGIEAREAAVFGLQPTPAAVWKAERRTLAIWRRYRGDEPLTGPSSQFVNEDKYPVWQGLGENQDSWVMAEIERRELRFEARRAAGEFGDAL
ncbi:hypothetical protein GQ53DRAFT_745307 [Thozetella sp. PMI_491]|nr:hypothetical protein GQ53DRAFT_745307 [Thozetella sp. PMI_491]